MRLLIFIFPHRQTLLPCSDSLARSRTSAFHGPFSFLGKKRKSARCPKRKETGRRRSQLITRVQIPVGAGFFFKHQDSILKLYNLNLTSKIIVIIPKNHMSGNVRELVLVSQAFASDITSNNSISRHFFHPFFISSINPPVHTLSILIQAGLSYAHSCTKTPRSHHIRRPHPKTGISQGRSALCRQGLQICQRLPNGHWGLLQEQILRHRLSSLPSMLPSLAILQPLLPLLLAPHARDKVRLAQNAT